MNKFVINGDFLCRNLTGIERFSYEVLKNMDNFVEKNQFCIYIPKNCKNIPSFKNIEVIISTRNISSFWTWCQFTFAFFAIKNKMIGINFSNTAPIISCGIVFLHDIYCKIYKKDFKTIKDKIVRIYSCFMYKFISKHAKVIFTVSEFSKNQICSTYKVSPDKIFVIPNGWDHFKEIQSDDSIIKNNPKLQNAFYFTLGSLSKRKNLKWIAEYAQNHPQEHFAISGKAISGLVPEELKCLQTLPNVSLLGYVSDGHVKALMQKCKAFVFPSYYEGFGIPPLEALSCGTQIIVSKSASLPEIYGETAHYIDADNTNVELSELLTQPVAKPDEILEKYTYENAAKDLYKVLSKYI